MITILSPRLPYYVNHTGSPTDLNILAEGYRLCARTEGKSPNTITLNATALKIFEDFLETHGYPTDVNGIDVPQIRHFIAYLQEQKAWRKHPTIKPRSHGLAGHSIDAYLRAIRAFWTWLVSEEITTANPFTRVKFPRPPKKVVPTFTEDQLRSLLAVLDPATGLGVRDRAMLLLFLDTGLRVSELVNADLVAVDLTAGTLKVCGKGSRERVVPLGVKVQRALWKYIHQCRPEPTPDNNKLFLNRNGWPISPSYVQKRLKRYARKTDIRGVRVSPHTFRHTFALSYLRNGGDVFSLQRILGHSSLDVVRIYVNLAQSDVREAHRRCSPADHMCLTPKDRAL
ncbi:MAG: tyrosine-type recombinase/integrase [Dehalococcoidales bacterium]|nr:tyrosine-type recombinase/integrase [Dehalococcoidales bacterium]